MHEQLALGDGLPAQRPAGLAASQGLVLDAELQRAGEIAKGVKGVKDVHWIDELGNAQAILDAIPCPRGYDLTVAGSFEEQEDAFRELLVALGLSLVLVYLVLAAQYESFRSPLVVMLSVPVAAVGEQDHVPSL